MNPKILITGSSGRIGRNAVEALRGEFFVAGFDRDPPPADAPQPHEFVRGSLPQDSEALQTAMEGVDAVIHLAGVPDDVFSAGEMAEQSIDSGSAVADLIGSNVLGTCQVLMASAQAGVKRIILASTGQVIDGWVTDGRSRVDDRSPLAPRYLYACTKVFMESAGRVFAKSHGLEVLILRLGWCPRPGQETSLEEDPRAAFVYLGGQDIGNFLLAALRRKEWPTLRNDPNTPTGPAIPYSIAYVTSLPPGGQEVYDLSVARSFGYEPDPDAGWESWSADRRKS